MVSKTSCALNGLAKANKRIRIKVFIALVLLSLWDFKNELIVVHDGHFSLTVVPLEE